MQPRPSCADSTFPKLPHETTLAVIRGLGIDAADICVFTGYDHTPPETVLSDPDGAAEAIRERLDRHRLVVSDMFAILGSDFQEQAINHLEPAVRAKLLDNFKRLPAFARRLDAPGMTILPGTAFDRVDEDESLELAAQELNRRAETAGEAGLNLAFEPHYGSIPATRPRALELLERTPDVGLALDYSHFVYQGVPEEEVDPLPSRTHHFHVRQAAPGVMQARTREGTIDFERVRGKLFDLGYTGYLALEYQWEDGWLDFTHVDCVAETAEMRDLLLGTAGAGNGRS